MRKIYSLLLLFMAVTMGAMAQSVYTYEPKDVSQADWSWPAGTNAATAGDSKDVVIRNHNNTTYFVGALANELKVDNNLSGKQYKFRFIQTGTTNRYKIYAVDAQKFVKWKTNAKQGNITELVEESAANDWLVVNDNNASSYNGAFDIIATNGSYAHDATCWNAHGGLLDERPIGGWDANDANSSWEICKENAAVTLTYNLKYQGVQKKTVTLPAKIGGNYPSCELPANCTATFPTGTVSVAGTHDVEVTLGSDYPFVPVSGFTQGNNWYVLTIRNLYISYNSTSHKLERSATAPTTYSDNYLFQFKGNPFDGYKILNRQAGTGKAAGSASVANQVVLEMMTEAQARNYVLTNASGFHFREKDTPNGYLNDNQGVSYWMNGAAANDVGGKFTFTKIDLNDHLISYKKRKAELNHLLSNTSAQALFNATTVTTVKNEMTAYNPENTEAGNTTALAKVDSWYNTLYASIDTQVTLQTPARAGKYVTVDIFGNVCHKPTKGAESAFLVKGSAAGVTFTHVASTRKVGNTGNAGGRGLLAGFGDSATQGVFKLKVFDGNTDQVAFICNQPGHTHHNSIHADNNGYVVAWEGTSVGGSTWKVEKSNYNEGQLLAAAKQRLSEAEQLRPLGVELGQYYPEPAQDYIAAEESEDIPTIEKALVAALNAKLNMPEEGQFFRIKTTKNGEKYISANNVDNRLSIVASAEASTLFYFDGTNLVGVDAGKFVALKSNFPAIGDYSSAGQTIEFHESKNANALSIYRINVGNRGLFADANSQKTDAGAKNSDSDGYRFKLEEVDELPIVVGETGYATFFTPVPATLANATAYKAKRQGTNLVLTSIEGTIPGNTAFVVRATPNTTVNLQLSATAAAALTDNDLTGAVTTAAAPISATDNVYALVKNASGEAVFGKLAAGLRKRAFRAFVTTASGSAQALDFSFGHVTGIETLDTGAAHAPIYDLSGRRVLTPAQGGVYLQNGKKFIQK